MKKLIYYFTIILAVAMLTACGGGSDSDGDEQPNNDSDTGLGSVKGVISDAGNGKRLQDVTISIGDIEVSSDSNGEFEINGLAQQDYVAEIQKANYAHGYSNVTIGSSTDAVVVALKEEGERQDYSADTEATIFEETVNGPYAVIFQADSFDTTDTNLKVSVTPLDPTVEANALPGQLETDTAMLVPLTFAEFSIFDTAGNKVNLKDGKEAIVELPIPATLRNLPEYELGKTIHCFSYNPETGQWEDFVVGTIVKSSIDNTTPVVRASIKHFSWYGAAPQSSDCVDIYGQIISSNTGLPLPYARVEAFPGSATTADANGNFRLATAASGLPKITASRTFEDTDGSITGTPGALVIEYGSLADIPLVGLVSRPCSDAPGTTPSGSSSTEPGSIDNPITVSIGSLGTASYEIVAYLTEESIIAWIYTNLPGTDQQGELVTGANIVLTGPNGFSVTLDEFQGLSGYYTADVEPEIGQRYNLNIDADNNGTVDGSGFVYITGDIAFTSHNDGDTVSGENLVMSWQDTATTIENADPNYSAMYWVWIYGGLNNETFSIDSANYLGTNTNFTVTSSINEGENLQPGSYTATLLSFSGAYLPNTGGNFSWGVINNITGSSVNGQFYVFNDFGGSNNSISFTVE